MSDRITQTEASVKSILATLWGIARGTIDSLRLSAAERLTLLLAAITVAALTIILGSTALLFASIGAARLLESVSPHGAYFIIAGFYAALLIVIVLLRRPLIADPIARLVTRLLVAPPPAPETDDTENQPQPAAPHHDTNQQ